jgi:hypothetical protein
VVELAFLERPSVKRPTAGGGSERWRFRAGVQQAGHEGGEAGTVEARESLRLAVPQVGADSVAVRLDRLEALTFGPPV